MALSPYQAPPFRTMDDAQHIPTSAQHGAKHTMASVALTQQMSVSDTTTVAGKFRALHGHGSIQAIKRFYSHTTLLQQGTQATSACIYPNFSAPCAEYTNNLQRDPRVSPGTDKASSHTSQHLMEICWHHTGATSYLGKPLHQYFWRHARTTQQCTTRISRTTKG